MTWIKRFWKNDNDVSLNRTTDPRLNATELNRHEDGIDQALVGSRAKRERIWGGGSPFGVVCAANTYVNLPWVHDPTNGIQTLPHLLDFTDPLQPKVQEDGIYAVSITFTSQNVAPQPTKSAFYAVDLDAFGEDAYQEACAFLVAHGSSQLTLFSLNCINYVPAGGILQAQVNHDDTISSNRRFFITGGVQKIGG